MEWPSITAANSATLREKEEGPLPTEDIAIFIGRGAGFRQTNFKGPCHVEGNIGPRWKPSSAGIVKSAHRSTERPRSLLSGPESRRISKAMGRRCLRASFYRRTEPSGRCAQKSPTGPKILGQKTGIPTEAADLCDNGRAAGYTQAPIQRVDTTYPADSDVSTLSAQIS